MRDRKASSKILAVDQPDDRGLEMILSQIIDAAEDAHYQMHEIAEGARQEHAVLLRELAQLKQDVSIMIRETESCEKEEKAARRKLMEVSGQFNAFSERDIKAAYEQARQLQVRLSTLKEREKGIILRRDDVERSLRRIQALAQKAEALVDKVTLAVRLLKGNFEKLIGSVEGAERKREIGIWMIQAQEEERRKIARELHDGPAQSLANLMIRLDLISRQEEPDGTRGNAEIASIKEMTKAIISEVRRVVYDLRPAALDDYGLLPAIRRYFEDYEEKYEFKIQFIFLGVQRRLDHTLETAFFRLIQEALNNTRRHAGISEATVKLEINEDRLAVSVQDRGCGFDPSAVVDTGKYGLLGMKERVELIGGEFLVKTCKNGGTQIIAQVPLETWRE